MCLEQLISDVSGLYAKLWWGEEYKRTSLEPLFWHLAATLQVVGARRQTRQLSEIWKWGSVN